MSKKNRVCWALVTALVAISLMMVGCAKPKPTPTMEPVTLLFDCSVYSATSPFGKVMRWFSDEVTKTTDGVITFKYTYAFSLSKPGEGLDQVASGVSDLCFTPVVYYPGALYLNNCNLAVFGAPNDLMLSWKIWDKLIYEEAPALGKEFEKYGVKLIYFAVDPPQVVESRIPITKLEDFEGKKIAASGYYLPRFFQALGATTLPTTVADRGTALQTGMLDGSVLPPNVSFPFKLHEFAPYYLEIGLGAWYCEAAFINLELFNSFPKDIQKIFVDVGREASRHYVDVMASELESEREARKAAGVTFNSLSDEDMKKWAELVGEPVAECVKRGEETGFPEIGELMGKYLRLCREEGHKFPKEWALD